MTDSETLKLSNKEIESIYQMITDNTFKNVERYAKSSDIIAMVIELKEKGKSYDDFVEIFKAHTNSDFTADDDINNDLINIYDKIMKGRK